MANQIIFRTGSEYSMPSGKNAGTLYLSTDGTRGKLWFDESATKRINIVPDLVDSGEWSYSRYDSGCCFLGGTRVIMNKAGGFKPIENIHPGDQVLSYNIFTKEFYPVVVQQLIVNNNTTDLATVFFDNGLELGMNAYHPLYTKEGFHSLTNHNNYDTLAIGDEVKTMNGWSKITNIERVQLDTPIVTYNLATKDFGEQKDDDEHDTFIVEGFVVHNAACPT